MWLPLYQFGRVPSDARLTRSVLPSHGLTGNLCPGAPRVAVPGDRSHHGGCGRTHDPTSVPLQLRALGPRHIGAHPTGSAACPPNALWWGRPATGTRRSSGVASVADPELRAPDSIDRRRRRVSLDRGSDPAAPARSQRGARCGRAGPGTRGGPADRPGAVLARSRIQIRGFALAASGYRPPEAGGDGAPAPAPAPLPSLVLRPCGATGGTGPSGGIPPGRPNTVRNP